MGGIAVLLLIAAGGITYGWRPDDDGGVEYLIQIPPDQIQDLQRIGQISSTIDPEVRGHVSRIVIQVGQGPLPKLTPHDLNRANRTAAHQDGARGDLAAADNAPIPIPEMGEGAASMPLAGIETSSSQEVMKPQTGESASGSGFALPPSLANTNVGPPSARVDAAGREIGGTNTGSGANARLIIPPPATRGSNATTLPPFTGSEDPTRGGPGTFGAVAPNMATVRPGGPSTDPTNSRSRNWTTLGQDPMNGPTTDPVRTATPSFPSASANGLSATDTFGRAPAAVGGTNTFNTAANNNSISNSNSNPAGFGGAGMSNASNNVSSNASTNPFQARETNSNPAYGTNQPAGGFGANGALNNSAALNNAFNTNNANALNTGAAANGSSNRSLTPAEIAAGAWSVDAYGNPIDREGRPIQRAAVGAAGSNPNLTSSELAAEYAMRQRALNQAMQQPNPMGLQTQNPRYSDPSFASLGTPAAGNSSPIASREPAYQPPAGYQDPSSGYRAPVGRYAAATETGRPVQPSYGMESERSVVSPSVRTVNDPPSLVLTRGEGENVEAANQRNQANPLVTWLLLISFVGNVYLMFWMKKLLVRYRDLVAAKRVSDSRAAA